MGAAVGVVSMPAAAPRLWCCKAACSVCTGWCLGVRRVGVPKDRDRLSGDCVLPWEFAQQSRGDGSMHVLLAWNDSVPSLQIRFKNMLFICIEWRASALYQVKSACLFGACSLPRKWPCSIHDVEAEHAHRRLPALVRFTRGPQGDSGKTPHLHRVPCTQLAWRSGACKGRQPQWWAGWWPTQL